MTTKFTGPVVGMHYRPPARAIMAYLPGGATVLLEREPMNQYDANAVKVLVDVPSQVPESQRANLAIMAEGFGFTLEQLLDSAANPWHLGYVAKEVAVQLSPALADHLDRRLLREQASGDPEARLDRVPAVLGFDAKGKPFMEVML